MHPVLHLDLWLTEYYIPTSNFLIGFLLFVTLIGFPWALRTRVPVWRTGILVLLTGAAAFWGARIFHVLFELDGGARAGGIGKSLQRFDGMTFYGSLFLGMLVFWISTRLLVPAQPARALAWDLAAIFVALGYGVLRLGCFATGCCWGRLTALPWAVRYKDPGSVMPYLGLPVHPVQLYDSFLGFALALILFVLNRRSARYRGRLFLVFLALYSMGRFVTEWFRGDRFRGEGLWLGLSTSQLISVAILVGLAVVLLVGRLGSARSRSKLRPKWAATGATLLVLLSLGSGCLRHPQEPGPKVIRESSQLGEDPAQALELHRFRTPLHAGKKEAMNLIYVALDDTVQYQFGPRIEDLYGKPVRLEELSWWVHAPKFRGLYREVIRIPHDRFTSQNLLLALQAMESRGIPYDLILLTHGIPNHLVTTRGTPLFSWKDLAALQGKLPSLRLVFMQSCFGSSLEQDWHAAGAKAVMSYPGLNRNFFYLDFFLREYRQDPTDIRAAWKRTNRQVKLKIRTSPLYRRIIREMGLGVGEYLRDAPHPRISL